MSPLDYDKGNKFRRVFEDVRCEFAEKNHHFCPPQLPVKDPEIWKTAPQLFRGIANVKSRVNYILPRNSPNGGALTVQAVPSAKQGSTRA